MGKLFIWLVSLATVIVFFLIPVSAFAETSVVIAVQNDRQSSVEAGFLNETVQYISGVFCDQAIRVLDIPYKEIQKLASERKINYAILSPDSYAALERLCGAHALVSQKRTKDTDKKIIGGALVVRTSENNIKQLSDLKSVAVVQSESNAFFVKAFLREIQLGGFSSFYRSPIKMEKIKESEIELINRLIEKQHEAVLLPFGRLEQLIKTEPRLNNEVKVIVPAFSNSSFDYASTPLYPGWTVAAFPPADSVRTSLLTRCLLEMPSENSEFDWALAPNYESVHELLTTTQDKDYLTLTKPSIFAFFKQFWIFFVFILFAVLGLIIHTLRTEFLVKKKTQELTQALREKEAMKKEVNAYLQRLSSLERIAMAGEISSMLAHELKQPMGVIHNYARGITRLLNKNTSIERNMMESVIKKIDEQSKKAALIIDHVRNYAKNKERNKIPVDLCLVSKETIKNFTMVFNFEITSEMEPDVFIIGDPLEIELLLNNLLKNALEAVSQVKHPTIHFSLTKTEDHSVIEISDNGPKLTDQKLKSIGTPLQSNKPSGWGLGLVIVRRIVESAGGEIRFCRNTPTGVRAIVTWPLYKYNSKKRVNQ